mmetsp:Transcript_33593/g.70647  ORF Transcript_33593/g.70647 Transcript_33593/m.70647 type:complete len:351 (-) Transcript_33593:510-1562(-)
MEGRREIEAAKLRVTAANRMMEAAQTLMETAKKEVEDAVAFLKDTEERLEKIYVDDDEDAISGSDLRGSKKRRKVSMSPSGSNRDPADDGGVPVDVIGTVLPDRQNATNSHVNEGGQMGSGARDAANDATATSTAHQPIGSDTSSRGPVLQEGAQEGAILAPVGDARTASVAQQPHININEAAAMTPPNAAPATAAPTPPCDTCGSTKDVQEDVDNPGDFYCISCWEEYDSAAVGSQEDEEAPPPPERNVGVDIANSGEAGNDAASENGNTNTSNERNALLLQKAKADFQTAIDNHRDDTLLMLKQSAARGESSIPVSKIAACRLKNIRLMRAVISRWFLPVEKKRPRTN